MGMANAHRCGGTTRKMRSDRHAMKTAMLAALLAGSANAAPIEGAMRSNLAALLLILGVGALLMSLRNLRDLRHKRLITNREIPTTDELPAKTRDPGTPD